MSAIHVYRSVFAVALVLGCFTNLAPADDFALVVGVNHCPKFRLPDGSKPRPLRAAESDAQAMAELLMGRLGFSKDRVRVLTGESATRAALQTAFKELAQQLRPNDHLWFHFAGHGTQVPDQKPFDEDDDLDEALCLADSEADIKTLVLDDELGRWLDDLPARRVTVLLDCCHSGTGLKDADPDLQSRFLAFPREPTSKTAKLGPWQEVRGDTKSLGRDITAFFACRPEQQAYERRMTRGTDAVRAGQFTHFVLEAMTSNMADRNGDQTVSRQELLDYVAGRLDETFNAQRLQPGEQQQTLLETDRPALPLFPR